jgi:hypothetical protein
MIAPSKSINSIFSQFNTVHIEKFLSKEYEDEIIIDDVENNVIIGNFKTGQARFLTHLNTSSLKIGTKIRIRFKFVRFSSNDFVRIRPLILFWGPMQESDTIFKEAKQFSKIQTKLSQTIKPKRKCPSNIQNVGLIVTDTHTDILNQFKSKFKSCLGTLFIYKINTNNLKYDFINAINYFNKYHLIDLICIVTQKLDPSQLLALSSTYVLSHFKSVPYVMSVSSENISKSFDYLVLNLFDKQYGSVDDAVHLIHQIQTEHQLQIINGIDYGKSQLENIVKMYQRKIDILEFNILDLNPYQINIEYDPIAELKRRVIKALDHKLNKLIMMELFMAKSICDMADQLPTAVELENIL